MKTILAAALALCLAPFAAHAQSAADKYPEKPIRIVVPFAPGGSVDTLGRLLAQRMNEGWGVPVLVENRPGAANMIGTQSVATAPPDGYTLLIAVSTHATNPALQAKIPYDGHQGLRADRAAGAHAGRSVHAPVVSGERT